jgi:hypothetical protein
MMAGYQDKGAISFEDNLIPPVLKVKREEEKKPKRLNEKGN